MPSNRRLFLQTLGAAGVGRPGATASPTATVEAILAAARALGARSSQEAARDEAFWSVVRDAFEGVRSSIKLWTVARGLSPRVVTDAVIDGYLRMNQSRKGGNNYPERREEVRNRLAAHVGCAPRRSH